MEYPKNIYTKEATVVTVKNHAEEIQIKEVFTEDHPLKRPINRISFTQAVSMLAEAKKEIENDDSNESSNSRQESKEEVKQEIVKEFKPEEIIKEDEPKKEIVIPEFEGTDKEKKDAIEKWAREELNIELDKRKSFSKLLQVVDDAISN